MLTLYDFLDSGNGYKVRLALRELGQPFVYREVNILRGETREEWFLAKNPVGEIPVLELEDGTCLCESTAILFHLAEGTRLLPANGIRRTRVLQWMCFEQTHVDGVISRARFRRRYPDAIATRDEEFETWWAEGKRALAALEHQLKSSDYLVGGAFSIADICLFAYVHCASEGGFDMQSYPAILEWCRRIQSRAAFIPLDRAPA
ncbi:MAG TPA: glutathione S-transferase family protein [Polyangiaceae bacterium]|nr:glutathione S-transferase family protein [Polyangiaceae bacterium]